MLLHLVNALQNLADVGQVQPGATVYRQNDFADYWYCIVSGAARECRLQVDGRRQVVDFLLPGDLFGFCDRQEHHLFSVEVLAPATTLARFSRRRVEVLVESDREVGRNMREMTLQSIMRLQTRTVLLGRPTAAERLGAFLLEMMNRAPQSDHELTLPMSRYDIADYLAIAVETLSRAFTALRHNGVIALHGSRSVRILKREELENPSSFLPPRRPHRNKQGWQQLYLT